jgi:hypothetical protein
MARFPPLRLWGYFSRLPHLGRSKKRSNLTALNRAQEAHPGDGLE